jgi:outer membrane lipoprotein LolB
MIKKLSTLLCSFIVLYGCASKKVIEGYPQVTNQSKELRIAQVKKINQWKINGKIAFLQDKKRESASLFWQFNQDEQKQTLKLTTYLGINVLSLTSEQGLHSVEVDGETYQGSNLEQLIYSLTEITLPTQALHFWLKGLEFSSDDQIKYDDITGLPKKLTSFHHGQNWQVNYGKYQQVNDVILAHQFSIKQNNLTIKITINKWKL